MEIIMKRRNLLKALSATPLLAAQVSIAQEEGLGPRQGRIKQSVMPQVWTGTDFSIEERCEILSSMGFAGMDLPQPDQISVLQDYGLSPTLMGGRIGTGTSFQDGLIRRELHDSIEEAIQDVAVIKEKIRRQDIEALPELKAAVPNATQATKLLLQEVGRVHELHKKKAGIVHDYAIDFDAARAEIGRRLACLRDAGGG